MASNLTRIFSGGLDYLWDEDTPPSPLMDESLRKRLEEEKAQREQEQDARDREISAQNAMEKIGFSSTFGGGLRNLMSAAKNAYFPDDASRVIRPEPGPGDAENIPSTFDIERTRELSQDALPVEAIQMAQAERTGRSLEPPPPGQSDMDRINQITGENVLKVLDTTTGMAADRGWLGNLVDVSKPNETGQLLSGLSLIGQGLKTGGNVLQSTGLGPAFDKAEEAYAGLNEMAVDPRTYNPSRILNSLWLGSMVPQLKESIEKGDVAGGLMAGAGLGLYGYHGMKGKKGTIDTTAKASLGVPFDTGDVEDLVGRLGPRRVIEPSPTNLADFPEVNVSDIVRNLDEGAKLDKAAVSRPFSLKDTRQQNALANLKSMRTNPEIAAKLAEIGGDPQYLGAGYFHDIFDLGNDKVLRVNNQPLKGQENLPWPDSPLVQQPISRELVGDKLLEVLPKIDKSKGRQPTDLELLTTEIELANQNLGLIDPVGSGGGNVWMMGDKPVILDPGAVAPLELTNTMNTLQGERIPFDRYIDEGVVDGRPLPALSSNLESLLPDNHPYFDDTLSTRERHQEGWKTVRKIKEDTQNKISAEIAKVELGIPNEDFGDVRAGGLQKKEYQNKPVRTHEDDLPIWASDKAINVKKLSSAGENLAKRVGVHPEQNPNKLWPITEVSDAEYAKADANPDYVPQETTVGYIESPYESLVEKKLRSLQKSGDVSKTASFMEPGSKPFIDVEATVEGQKQLPEVTGIPEGYKIEKYSDISQVPESARSIIQRKGGEIKGERGYESNVGEVEKDLIDSGLMSPEELRTVIEPSEIGRSPEYLQRPPEEQLQPEERRTIDSESTRVSGELRQAQDLYDSLPEGHPYKNDLAETINNLKSQGDIIDITPEPKQLPNVEDVISSIEPRAEKAVTELSQRRAGEVPLTAKQRRQLGVGEESKPVQVDELFDPETGELISEGEKLPPVEELKSPKDFHKIADLQRGEPESVMLKAADKMGGGVMQPAIEHIGDLSHRMTEERGFHNAGYPYVKEKVDKALRWLTNPYGFRKEFLENLDNNAKGHNVDPQRMKSEVFTLLNAYADAHSKLPAYNRAQTLARDAAVSLGRLEFSQTIKNLRELQSHLKTQEDWVKFAKEGLTEDLPQVEPIKSPEQLVQESLSRIRGEKIPPKPPSSQEPPMPAEPLNEPRPFRVRLSNDQTYVTKARSTQEAIDLVNQQLENKGYDVRATEAIEHPTRLERAATGEPAFEKELKARETEGRKTLAAEAKGKMKAQQDELKSIQKQVDTLEKAQASEQKVLEYRKRQEEIRLLKEREREVNRLIKQDLKRQQQQVKEQQKQAIKAQKAQIQQWRVTLNNGKVVTVAANSAQNAASLVNQKMQQAGQTATAKFAIPSQQYSTIRAGGGAASTQQVNVGGIGGGGQGGNPPPTNPNAPNPNPPSNVQTFRQAWSSLSSGEKFRELWNIPRSIKSTLDLPILRQGKYLTINHPRAAIKSAWDAFKSGFSQRTYDQVVDSINNNPLKSLADEAGLDLNHDEAFPSNLAEKIAGVGRVVKGSDRAYSAYMNSMRMAAFENWKQYLDSQGYNATRDIKPYSDAAHALNILSFRGDIRTFSGQQVASKLADALYSPRMKLSHAQMIKDLIINDFDPKVSNRFRLHVAKTWAANASLLALGAAAGADVETDPESSDWMKLKIGNTRIDPWAGLQPMIRAAYLVRHQKQQSVKTGKTYAARPSDIVWRQFRNAMHPSLGAIWTQVEGKSPKGEKIDDKRMRQLFEDTLVPMLADDVFEAAKQGGWDQAIGVGIGSTLGENIRVYEERKEEKKKSNKKSSSPRAYPGLF